MITKHFKISDTDGTVLDLSDLLKVELRNEDETIIAMRKHLDEETLENLYFRQHEQSEPAQTFGCAVHPKTQSRKQNQRSQSRIYERQFSSRDRLTDKLNPVVPVILTMKERHRPLQSLGH